MDKKEIIDVSVYLNAGKKTPKFQFEWLRNNQHAYFDVCPIWKNGFIVKVHISLVGQEWPKNIYINSTDGFEGIDFEHLYYEYDTIKGKKHRINFPTIWKTFWCDKHKTQAIRFYVPRNANSFFLSRGLEKLCFNWR